MRRFVVTTDILMVAVGSRIEIDADQARARRYALRPVCGDVYEVTTTVGFKRGEVIGCDPAPHPIFASEIEPEETSSTANDGSLEGMDRKALIQLAEDIGVKLSQYRSKQVIIDEIRGHRATA